MNDIGEAYEDFIDEQLPQCSCSNVKCAEHAIAHYRKTKHPRSKTLRIGKAQFEAIPAEKRKFKEEED